MNKHNNKHAHYKIAENYSKSKKGSCSIPISNAGIYQSKKRRTKRKCKEQNDNNR